MGFYSNYIFPRLIDWAMNDKELVTYRKEVLAPAQGRVLEIGFGTGVNLPFYPSSVENLIAVESNASVLKKAGPRIKIFPGKVETLVASAEKLPLDAHSVDFIVSTFTLCSIPDIYLLLGELKRVLKRDGTFLFLEHGLAPDPKIQTWQNRLTPLQKKIGCGCHLNRNILGLFSDYCWDITQRKSFFLPRSPKVIGYMTLGEAVP